MTAVRSRSAATAGAVTVQRQLQDLALAATMAPLSDNGQAQATRPTHGSWRWREQLKNMRMKLTADHPDIRTLTRVIKDLEQKAAAEAHRRQSPRRVSQPC
jgi:hypothetical protein